MVRQGDDRPLVEGWLTGGIGRGGVGVMKGSGYWEVSIL